MKFIPLLLAYGGVTYASAGGANWAVVSEPFVMSTHNIEELYPDTLHITDLENSTARMNCAGEGAPLVIFLDHGVPGINLYAPQGSSTGFKWVYWDYNNDSKPDGQVLALDLTFQTDVWVTWGLEHDLTVRYLRPGYQIDIAGFSRQSVYHPTASNEASASGTIGCDRDKNARRGGHQTIAAYSLSRMW